MPSIELNEYQLLNLIGAFKRMRSLSRKGIVYFDNGDWFTEVLTQLIVAGRDATYNSNNFGDTFDIENWERGRFTLHNKKRN